MSFDLFSDSTLSLLLTKAVKIFEHLSSAIWPCTFDIKLIDVTFVREITAFRRLGAIGIGCRRQLTWCFFYPLYPTELGFVDVGYTVLVENDREIVIV